MEDARNILHDRYKQEWSETITSVPKLRTYVKYKEQSVVEPYVYNIYNRGHRSTMAQFWSSILTISIETGSYKNIPEEYNYVY